MKKQDQEKIWQPVVAIVTAALRDVETVMQKAAKPGSLLTVLDDRLVVEMSSGARWSVDRRTGKTTYQSRAERYPHKQTEMFK